MYLINFTNQHAAGPKNIAINFFKFARDTNGKYIFLLPDLEEFRSLHFKDNVKVRYVKKRFGLVGAIFNAALVNSIIIPRILKTNKITAILAFGNFLSFPTTSKKIVLLHHPYLVDEDLYQSLSLFSKGIERLKRLLFSKTVKNVDVVVVQSKYMQDCFRKKYPNQINKTIIIPNPLSSALSNLKKMEFHKVKEPQDVFKILYVSRFYAHKNHDFILALSKLLLQKKLKHEFLLTIDNRLPGAKGFLLKSNATETITNLGELPQGELQKYYRQADLFVFPSKSETFGNPIIEAMFFSCPLLLPDLGYARALADKAAEFYDPASADSCASLIFDIASNSSKRQELRRASHEAGKLQLNVKDWFNLYFCELTQSK